VNGRLVVRDRRLLTVDVDELIAEFCERAARMPFRQPLDEKTRKDIADAWAFWWEVMRRVERGE
jgi:spermidine synthase